MNIKHILMGCLLLCNTVWGQIAVIRNFNLELAEKDSLTSHHLETSINAFLTEAQNGTYSDKYIDSNHRKQYEFFFHKLARIGKNSKSQFHQPLVVKSYTSDHKSYRITVAFTGMKKETPFLYQLTELKAVPYQGHYRFYCPFEENTAHFRTKQIDNVTYHSSRAINENNARAFVKLKNQLEELAQTDKIPLDYYCFQSLDEMLKSYGFLYSARQCNFLCYDLGFTDSQGKIYVTGTKNENYISGYIGDFLYYNLPNKDDMYWPFVQGISTYYGGYGLSYDTLEELKQQFRNELKKNPDINFLTEFKKGRKSAINRHFSYYVMSAFLCEELMKTNDFKSVLKLAYSGDKGEQFFSTLKEVLQIDEADFHQKIVQLINE